MSWASETAFIDINNVSDIARILEVICVLSGGPEDITKNTKFRITMNGIEMEQENPGQAYKYDRIT